MKQGQVISNPFMIRMRWVYYVIYRVVNKEYSQLCDHFDPFRK